MDDHAAPSADAARQIRPHAEYPFGRDPNTRLTMPSAFFSTCPMLGIRRAFPGHVRPASRDVSNDARSGNANRQAPPPSNPQSGKTKEQKPSSDSHPQGTAPDTIFSSQCKRQNRHRTKRCKLGPFPKDVFLTDQTTNAAYALLEAEGFASASARRPLLAAPAEHRPDRAAHA